MRLCDPRRSGIRMARERPCSCSCGNGHPCPFRGCEPAACRNSGKISGVGNGNRTRNRRSHSPVLCQLSYSHRLADYSNCDSELSDLKSTMPEGNQKLRGDQVRGVGEGLHRGDDRSKYRDGSKFRGCVSETANAFRYPRPTPTYSNPKARSRTESSRFFVSTMRGFLSKCLIRSKSSARNSGQPVPTTSASIPSAAA